MQRNEEISKNLDWISVVLFISCISIGWANIYAATYTPENPLSIFSSAFYSTNAGKQLIWIGTAGILITIIMVLDYRFYDTFAFVIYGILLVLLVAVLVIGSEIKGSHSWFKIGGFSLQPAEFAKTATVLALSKYLSTSNVSLKKFKDLFNVGLIIFTPIILIIASRETGSALVFFSLIILLYREGLSPIFVILFLTAIFLFIMALLVDILYISLFLVFAGVFFYYFILPRYERTPKILIGIGIIVLGATLFASGVNFMVEKVLQDHQRKRIKVLIDPSVDKKGVGYHVSQSKIAIGSGGWLGKGFLEGTQTKFDFVPEQSTDFIFCTIAEEHGFLGSTFVIALLIALLIRIVHMAERQRSPFSRMYGYGVASIIFFHFLINLGMTIGFMPVIGIPLPFFSYGGSSLWSFSILLFIFLKLDAQRGQVLSRR